MQTVGSNYSRLGAMAALVLLFATSCAAAINGYTAQRIDSPDGALVWSFTDLNENGAVLGTGWVPKVGSYHAFLWEDGHSFDLSPSRELLSVFPEALNDNNQVVGNYFDRLGSHSYIWQRGLRTELHSDLGQSRVYDISNTGAGVGAAGTPATRHAVAWTPGGDLDISAAIPGTSIAFRVNDAGQVAGLMLGQGDLRYHAFLWDAGELQDIGSPGTGSVFPLGISAAGDVLLWWETSGGWGYGVWRTGALVPIADVPNTATAAGAWINSRGEVLFATGSISAPSVFLINGSASVEVTSLVQQSLPEALQSVGGYNSRGQLVAYTAAGRHYLLTPTPEPCSLGLTGLGLCVAAALKRYARPGT